VASAEVWGVEVAAVCFVPVWDVVSATRWSSGVAPRACVRVYARVPVPPNIYYLPIMYIHIHISSFFRACARRLLPAGHMLCGMGMGGVLCMYMNIRWHLGLTRRAYACTQDRPAAPRQISGECRSISHHTFHGDVRWGGLLRICRRGYR